MPLFHFIDIVSFPSMRWSYWKSSDHYARVDTSRMNTWGPLAHESLFSWWHSLRHQISFQVAQRPPAPLVRRLLRPPVPRPPPPRFVTTQSAWTPSTSVESRLEPVLLRTPSTISDFSTSASSLSLARPISNLSISSYVVSPPVEIRKKSYCPCRPCCRPKVKKSPQETVPSSDASSATCKLNARTIYIILVLLFLLFVVVIVLLIVLIVVRR